jgi:PKHD-type hydroxylase
MAHSKPIHEAVSFQGIRDLANYNIFKNGLTDDDIARVLGAVGDFRPVEGQIDTKVMDDQYRRSSLRWIPTEKPNHWLYAKLGAFTNKTNSALWHFDLAGMAEIQFAEYESSVQGHYDWHLDVGKHSPLRKISVSVQLSAPEDYDGGDLQLMTRREPVTVSREKGAVVVFPSYCLHRVTPVTRGVRRSLVAWVVGPPYR